MNKSILTFALLTVGIFQVTAVPAVLCPVATAIPNCKCVTRQSVTVPPVALPVDLSCEGTVSQVNLVTLIGELKKAQNPASPAALEINKLVVRSTSLATLSLDPFADCTFKESLEILEIRNLARITPPTGNGARVSAVTLRVTSSLLNDANVINLLSYINPVGLNALDLIGNKMVGTADLFTGLAGLTDLYILILENNSISELGGGQFKALHKLLVLSLRGNRIHSLTKEAFAFNEWDASVTETRLDIYLTGNNLTDSRISCLYGLPSSSRRTLLNLEGNEFLDTLSRTVQTYLDDNVSNQLAVSPVFCDRRLLWIQEGASSYQSRVTGATCTNDPDYDVFSSSLVSAEPCRAEL